MKQKIFNLIFYLFCTLSIIFIFKNNNRVASIILEAINLFFKKVFVSLFPMFIINDILIALNFPYYFYKIFNNLFIVLFKTSGLSAYVFIMSLISGTPSNAYILKSLVDTNRLSVAEAEHYLYFTYFSNPLFLTLMLSLIFPPRSVLKIIIIHYLSNIVIAFLIRESAPPITSHNLEANNSTNISSILIKSINRSMSTLLMILGTIVFYMLLSFIITNIISTSSFLKLIVASLLEITNGLNLLAKTSYFLKAKEIIALATISFGGLSIHTQIKSILEDTDISYKPFLKGRFLQVLIGTILIIFI